MTSEPENTTAHYERKAESIRHSLSNALNELNQRMTAGQVLDEVLSYARGGSGPFLRSFSNAAQNNPLPSLLIGTGCMLFLSEKMGISQRIGRLGRGNGHRKDGSENGTKPSVVGRAAAAVGQQATKVGESVKHGAEAVGESIGSATQRVREKLHDARDTISGAVDQAKESAVDLGEGAAEATDVAREQAAAAARQMKNRATRLINEQPLLVAGIGLAVGAAIAAMLPSTRVENELMGKTSDSVKKSLGEAAADQFETARAAAGRIAEETKNAAAREGLTQGRAAEVMRDLGDRVAGVASETVRAGTDEIRSDTARSSTGNLSS